MDPRQHASIAMLSRCMFGITETSETPISEDEATLSADRFETMEDGGISTVVFTPSGDAYRISVTWLPEESP